MSNTLYRVIQKVKSRIIPTVLVKTANYTVKADELLYGAVLANSGASGAVVFALPAAQPGMRLTVAVVAAFNLTIDLPTGDTIRSLATSGQTATNAVAGSTMQLVCVVPNVWEAIGVPDGAWIYA
jgi:hypothetical protein